MDYFTIQVRTGSEDKFIKLFSHIHPDLQTRLVFPRRRLKVRHEGKTVDELSPVFPGYIFVETEAYGTELKLDPRLYWAIRKTDGFFRFLKSNQDVRPLEGKDLSTVRHFIGFGPVAEKSKVWFDDNDRIVIAEGPLKGLEGSIVKVDKRKGRAKIKLDLYDDSFSIDLAFEVIART